MKLSENIKQIIIKDSVNSLYAHRYIKFIESCRLVSNVFEKHHILPKSIYPDYENDPSNIINLSLREHFISHIILEKVFSSHKMSLTVFLMKHSKACKNRLSSKQYENLKLKLRKYDYNYNKIDSDIFSIPPWRHHKSTLESLTMWYIADICKNFLNECNLISLKALHSYVGKITCKSIKIKHGPYYSIIDNIYKGWDPKTDTDWLDFKENYKTTFEKLPEYFETPIKVFPLTNKLIIDTWLLSDILYEQYKVNPSYKRRNLSNICRKITGKNINESTVETLLSYFRKGWIPLEDIKWIEFKDKYTKLNESEIK